MSNFDWDSASRRKVLESRQTLERTSSSLARSNQIAIETENTGNEILSELDSQRESLLRASERLDNASDGLFESNKILKIMKRNVLYNRLILILIIVLEIFILASMLYLKFIH